MQGKITISKQSSQVGSGEIHVNIQDASSGTRIVETSMSLTDFADAITGLGNVSCEIVSHVKEQHVQRIGKKKEVKTVFIERDTHSFKYKEEVRDFVFRDCSKNHEGWMVWSDGTNTQQNSAGKHQYVICRYVDIEEDFHEEMTRR